MDDVTDALKRILETVLGRALPGIDRATVPSQLEGWHSLRHAQLVMTIEEQFDIEIPDEAYQRFETLGDLADLVSAIRDHGPA
ncbi:MAG: acyl carrier protein [Alphaproteobacteria bacterium]|nr:acyl carrier protein [Alphaproteobacteria bacterium]